MNKRKLAAVWNVWDGDELLPYSVKAIKPHVDIRIAVVQGVSNLGEEYEPRFNYSLFDYVVRFEPDLTKRPPVNETAKRNAGLRFAREIGATHYIGLDCDEIYRPEDFVKYRDMFFTKRVDSSYCKMRTYYKRPTWRLAEIEPYYVPFIARIDNRTRLGNALGFPFEVDPTRKVIPAGAIMRIEEPIMQHYSFVRADIGRKLRNSSSNAFRNNEKALAERFDAGELIHFQGYTLESCENEFGIVV
jgi:hypothetical protein